MQTINTQAGFGGCVFTPGDALIELGAVTLLGGNMDADGSCGVEQTALDPGLATALALALLPGAAAIDAGTSSGCFGLDQRGAVRPFDGDGNQLAQCDVGAYERGAPLGIFVDGFESGTTSAWSATVPSTCLSPWGC